MGFFGRLFAILENFTEISETKFLQIRLIREN